MKPVLFIIMLLSAAATTAQESFLMGGFRGRIDYRNTDAQVNDKKATFYQLSTPARSKFEGNKFYLNNGIGYFSGTYTLSGQSITFNTDTVRFDGNTIGYERGVFAYDELSEDMKQDALVLFGKYTYEEKKHRFVLLKEQAEITVKYRFSFPRRFHGFGMRLNGKRKG